MATQFDLILMDLQMPIMDGYTAIRQIRLWEKEQQKDRVTLISLSAYALKENLEDSMKAGSDAHLTKPISKIKFLTELKKWLD
jgi:CheY-like chemotaxis protein